LAQGAAPVLVRSLEVCLAVCHRLLLPCWCLRLCEGRREGKAREHHGHNYFAHFVFLLAWLMPFQRRGGLTVPNDGTDMLVGRTSVSREPYPPSGGLASRVASPFARCRVNRPAPRPFPRLSGAGWFVSFHLGAL
jgi:hypothetical protein